MHIKFRCSIHTRLNKSNIIYNIKSFNKRYLIWRTTSPCPDILGALAIHHLLAGLLLRLLLSLLLLLLGLLLLAFSIDISSKFLFILPSLLKFFLSYNQFLF
jgi:hypothetical protein